MTLQEVDKIIGEVNAIHATYRAYTDRMQVSSSVAVCKGIVPGDYYLVATVTITTEKQWKSTREIFSRFEWERMKVEVEHIVHAMGQEQLT